MSLLLSLMLTAAPAGPTTLIIEVSPEDTVVMVDGKKKGTGAQVITIKNINPGRHTIKVSRKGEGHEEDIEIKKGEKKTWKWAFEGSPPPKAKESKETEKPKETKVEESRDGDLDKM
jgi:PEGA domain